MTEPLHPKIQKFVEAMQHELEANAHKGDWEEWQDVGDILNELEYHKAKLLIALKEGSKGNAREYIADCANILLCLGNAGQLYELNTKSEECHHDCKHIDQGSWKCNCALCRAANIQSNQRS